MSHISSEQIRAVIEFHKVLSYLLLRLKVHRQMQPSLGKKTLKDLAKNVQQKIINWKTFQLFYRNVGENKSVIMIYFLLFSLKNLFTFSTGFIRNLFDICAPNGKKNYEIISNLTILYDGSTLIVKKYFEIQ